MLSKLNCSKMKNKMLLLSIGVAPINAIANTGHDHSSHWANLIHLLWFLRISISPFIVMKLNKKVKGIDSLGSLDRYWLKGLNENSFSSLQIGLVKLKMITGIMCYKILV